MQITATFQNDDEAIKAIHSELAWQTLQEINEVLRSNRKHGLPFEQTVSEIQASVNDALALIPD
jgi:hypothetical protein